MKKILASLLAMTMILTTLSSCIIPAQAEEGVAVASNVYVDEDFEDYTDLESNWAQNRDTAGYVLTTVGAEEKAWMIGGKNNTDLSKGGIVKIEKDPLATATDPGKGNVLMIDASNITAAGTNVTVIKKPIENGYTKRLNMNGKRIVIQTDIYIPKGQTTAEDTIFAYYNGGSKGKDINPSAANSYILPYNSMTGSPFVIGSGKYGALATTRPKFKLPGAWHTLKYVIDVSEQASATRIDTVRGYIDGNLLASPLGEGTKASGTLDTYPFYEKDGTTLRTIVDYWKRAIDPMAAPTGEGGTVGDFFGILMASCGVADEGGAKYYVDNMKSYYVEDLKATIPDLSDYTGGEIRIEFNNEIPESFPYMLATKPTATVSEVTSAGLNDLITFTDAEGNAVEGFEVRLSDDAKALVINPGSVESNKDYTIEISRYFRDAEGQGLTKNSTEYTIPVHVGQFVPFDVEYAPELISNFATNRDAKVEAVFTKNVTDAMILSGIEVKNMDTGLLVNCGEGWTYAFAVEEGKVNNKKVVFEFSTLETANYEITSNDNFSISGEKLAKDFKVTINKANDKIFLFNEDFETGYATGNLLIADNKSKDIASGTSLRSYTIASPDGKGDWDIQLHSSEGEAETMEVNDFFGIVDAPEGMGTGKVLKVTNSRSNAYSKDYIIFRKNFNKERKPYRFDDGEYKDKVLVYEADAYLPSVASDVQIMQPSTHKTTIYRHFEGMWKNLTTSGGKLRTSGGSHRGPDEFITYGHSVSWQRSSTSADLSEPGKIKVAIDQSTERDTMRVYVNGGLSTLKASSVAMLEGHAMNDPEGRYDIGPAMEVARMQYADQEWNVNTAKQKFTGSSVGDKEGKGTYGICTQVAAANGTERVYYFDNFKAYLVDAFEVEEVTGYGNNFNTEKGRVTFTFSKKVDLDTAIANKNIVLLDEAGKEVENGIESVTAKDGGYQLEVKLSETVAKEKEYTVWLKVGLRDCDGLSLRTQYSYYLYDIDAHYEKVAGKDNVYTIVKAGSKDSIEAEYTERVMDGDKVVTPAYLTYYKADGTTVVATAATDMYVKDYDKMKSRVSLVTAKSNSLSATATPAVVNGNTVTTKVSFSNPEVDAKEVWCVIAAFGEYEEMIGSAVVNIGEVEASSLTDEFEVSFTTKAGKTAKVVKMFVWNNKHDMAPYQVAESIWTK